MISLIAAVGKNNELGLDNHLIFNIPGDLKFFRNTTLGKTVIMGRKTYESIGKPIPKRINIRDVINIYKNLLLYFISLKENNKGYMFTSMITIPTEIQMA